MLILKIKILPLEGSIVGSLAAVVEHIGYFGGKSHSSQAPSSASRIIQEARIRAEKSSRFLEIFTEAGFDFYKIDPNIFAPAVVAVTSIRTGKTYRAGTLDIEFMKSSLGLP
jgi:methenyltetrahydromethanopterin cyclohydrolase